jgi:hypothetical protein
MGCYTFSLRKSRGANAETVVFGVKSQDLAMKWLKAIYMAQ